MSDQEQDYDPILTMDSLVIRRTTGLSTEKIIKKMVIVAEVLANGKLYPYQVEFAARVFLSILEREGEELTALFSRQGGKSHVLGALAGACMLILPEMSKEFPEDDRFRYKDPKSGTIRSYEEGFWIGVFAPKKEQSGIIYNKVRLFFKQRHVIEVAQELGLMFDTNNGDTLKLSNGSYIKCSTASDQANIEGATLHLGIMDEAQDISDEKATKSISPMLAATGGTVVKIGTANAKKSHYYNSIRRNKRRELEGASKTHFFADWTMVAKYNSFYEKYVKKEMMRMGERSDEFQMAYLCLFQLERGLAISETLFENRSVDEGMFSNILPGPRKGMHYVAGIDFGKLHDSTVVTVLEVNWDNPRQVLEGYDQDQGSFTVEIYGKHVVSWLEMQGDDYEAQFVEIQKFLSPWNISRLALDYTGVGVALGDRVKARFEGVDIDMVAFSAQSKDTMGRQLLADVHTGMITWPGGDELRQTREHKSFHSQMVDLEKEYRNGLLSLHHPDMRGAKDDYPDSLMLGVWAGCTKPFGGEVEETEENVYRK